MEYEPDVKSHRSYFLPAWTNFVLDLMGTKAISKRPQDVGAGLHPVTPRGLLADKMLLRNFNL
jgi:hypothetical protein